MRFGRSRYNTGMSAIEEFRERLKVDTQALEGAGLLKRERLIASAQGPVVVLADGRVQDTLTMSDVAPRVDAARAITSVLAEGVAE